MPTPEMPVSECLSLEDPGAEEKLTERLDALKARITFGELCELFECDDQERKVRLRAFVNGLVSGNSLIQVDRDLFCRPALLGRSWKPQKSQPGRKRRGKRDAAAKSEDDARLLTFIAAQEGGASKKALLAEGSRLGMEPKRVDYLLKCLRVAGKIVTSGWGRYQIVTEGAVSTPSVD